MQAIECGHCGRDAMYDGQRSHANGTVRHYWECDCGMSLMLRPAPAPAGEVAFDAPKFVREFPENAASPFGAYSIPWAEKVAEQAYRAGLAAGKAAANVQCSCPPGEPGVPKYVWKCKTCGGNAPSMVPAPPASEICGCKVWKCMACGGDAPCDCASRARHRAEQEAPKSIPASDETGPRQRGPTYRAVIEQETPAATGEGDEAFEIVELLKPIKDICVAEWVKDAVSKGIARGRTLERSRLLGKENVERAKHEAIAQYRRGRVLGIEGLVDDFAAKLGEAT